MSGPLAGIRILDLSQGAAGPSCGMLLGELGADVVKVEPPGGEWGRGLGPPFVGGIASAFLGMNRNKRSLVVDLKRPGAPEVLLRLAEGSDVVLETFRPGVADRLGIGYEAMAARNPTIVYLAISAFGQHGPWRDRPGVDGIVQAMSGLMSVTGTADGPPVKVGVPAADMAGGLFAVQGVLAALLERERTGHGQRVDLSLLDALLALQLVPLTMFLADGQPPGRLGSAAPYASPNEAFATSDGHVMVAAYTVERWPRFCDAMGLPELATDPRFDTNAKRVSDRDELRAILEPVFASATTAEWIARLDEADVICGPLLSYPELVAEEQVASHGAVMSTVHPVLGEVRSIAGPIRLGSSPNRPEQPAPILGEHSEEVLREFGFSADEVDDLLGHGAVLNGQKAPQPATQGSA
jgi:crotonobetainyl-CoA:carnitine CoA-transferase CaiB-like acyl-CoA transferase